MRDLEAMIAQWRRDARANGLRSAPVLDELEEHLREDIDQRMRSGEEMEKAFASAAKGLGGMRQLKTEFQKAQSTLIMNLSPATHRRLCEVLVVIALVAIQVSLLLPFVTKLRAQKTLAAFDIGAICILAVMYVSGIVCYVRKRSAKA